MRSLIFILLSLWAFFAHAATPLITEFSVNGERKITVAPGAMLNYKWSSINASFIFSSYTTSSSCPGGQGPNLWHAKNPAGEYTFPAHKSQAGCKYEITLVAASSAGRSQASIEVSVSDFGFGNVWRDGIWRTEYLDPLVGTTQSPFEVLLLNEATGKLERHHFVFPDPFSKTNDPNGWNSEENAVIVVANNEISISDRCPFGPPDQSARITEVDGGGLFGVSVWYSEYWNSKIFTIQANNNHQECHGGIPYLGVSVFEGNGIQTPVGYLNRKDGGGVTELSLQLERFVPGLPTGTQPVSGTVHAVAVAEWRGKKFMLQTNLFAHGLHWHGETFDWYWPYPQSTYFPGARVGFLEGAKVGIPDLVLLTPRRVSLDWNSLFRIADDMELWRERMPRDEVLPITHFQISIEITGLDRNVPGSGTDMVLSVWGVTQR